MTNQLFAPLSPPLCLQAIAASVQGTAALTGDATGFCIDTRQLRAGDVFIALQGDARDGHDFVTAALAGGAVAAIVSHVPEDVKDTSRLIIVRDTQEALCGLGRAARARSGARFIAITGSVGKTSTKEMLSCALQGSARVHAAPKSFNNHLGVPLTLAMTPDPTDIAIIEMGMNHKGEIARLTALVRPDIAVITTIAPVHVEFFDDGARGIAREKISIVDSMSPEGTVILPHDCAQFPLLLAHAQTQGIRDILTFGTDPSCDAQLVSVLAAANGIRVNARLMGDDIQFTLKDAGEHFALNALAALLAGRAAGYGTDALVRDIAAWTPVTGRGARERLDYGDAANPVLLLDESYNASPTSMKAAFKVLALIDPGRGGRRIAILGDMLEMGHDAARHHADLALPLRSANIDWVYTCGPMMKHLHDALPADQKKIHKPSSRDLAEIVPDALVPGDVVMVKGSLGSKMGLVVEALRARPSSSTGAKGAVHA